MATNNFMRGSNSFDAQAQALARRRKLADLLGQQASEQTQIAPGGRLTIVDPISKALLGYMSRLENEQATADSAKLEEARSAEFNRLSDNIPQGTPGRDAIPGGEAEGWGQTGAENTVTPEGQTAGLAAVAPKPPSLGEMVKWGSAIGQTGDWGQKIGAEVVDQALKYHMPNQFRGGGAGKSDRNAPVLDQRYGYAVRLSELMRKPNRTPEDNAEINALQTTLNDVTVTPTGQAVSRAGGGSEIFGMPASAPQTLPISADGAKPPVLPPAQRQAPGMLPNALSVPPVRSTDEAPPLRMMPQVPGPNAIPTAPPAPVAPPQPAPPSVATVDMSKVTPADRAFMAKEGVALPGAPAPSVPPPSVPAAPPPAGPSPPGPQQENPYLPTPAVLGKHNGLPPARPVQPDLDAYGKKLRDDMIPDLEYHFGNMNGVLDRLATTDPKSGVVKNPDGTYGGNAPGFGGPAGIMNMLPVKMTEAGRDVAAAYAPLKNIAARARSGAAVTDQELQRLLVELGQAAGQGDKQFWTAYTNLQNGVGARRKAIDSETHEHIRKVYKDRGSGGKPSVPRAGGGGELPEGFKVLE